MPSMFSLYFLYFHLCCSEDPFVSHHPFFDCQFFKGEDCGFSLALSEAIFL